MYHLFPFTLPYPKNLPKLHTIRWVFVMLPSLSIGLTSNSKFGCQPSNCSKFLPILPFLPWIHGFSGKFAQMKGNDPIGDTSIFHWNMIMGGRAKQTPHPHFWGRDTLKSTLIKTRLSLTSRVEFLNPLSQCQEIFGKKCDYLLSTRGSKQNANAMIIFMPLRIYEKKKGSSNSFLKQDA